MHKTWRYVMVGGLICILVFTLWYTKFTPQLQLTKPFLEEVFISQVTFDGKEVLFAKRVEIPENARIGKLPYHNCNVLLKNIETGKETQLKRFNFNCDLEGKSFAVSKNKKYVFFHTTEDPFEKIKGTDRAVTSPSIYAYDLTLNKFILIKQTNMKENSEGVVTESYYLINPSPLDDEKMAFTKQIERVNPTKTQYGYTIELWLLDMNTQDEQLIYQENLTGDIWLQNRYQPFLTRWSPDGKAIIYEIGEQRELGQKRRDVASEYNNRQYIYYLGILKPEELKPENVKENITKCGYYYNGALKPYFDIDNSLELRNKVFFPDGKTYIKVDVCGSEICAWNIKNYLKTSAKQYCAE